MTKESRKIFLNGKEDAIKSLFLQQGSRAPVFGYLALGYDENTTGFETSEDFKELSLSGYKRPQLEIYSGNSVEKDEDTGKVTVRLQANVTNKHITGDNIPINQIAIVDTSSISTEDKFYCASTFDTFTKQSDSSLTFVLSFRL